MSQVRERLNELPHIFLFEEQAGVSLIFEGVICASTSKRKSQVWIFHLPLGDYRSEQAALASHFSSVLSTRGSLLLILAGCGGWSSGARQCWHSQAKPLWLGTPNVFGTESLGCG